MKSTPLKFNYLKFDIIDIVAMIDYCPTILDFVFTATSSNGDGYMQLVAHARILVPQNQVQYSDMTKVLQPYRAQAYQVDGPVILTNNYIAIATMKQLIGYSGGQSSIPSGFLLFTPGLTDTNYIYYTVTAYNVINGVGAVLGGDSSTDTNPSPPATMTI
ncbi:MAG: hypothetical protein ACXVAY_17145 [Mucilaginibacter sp.]